MRDFDMDLGQLLNTKIFKSGSSKSTSPNLKLSIMTGIGSDHVGLQTVIDNNITICEVTFCNSISVSEHAVMMILALVRGYIPQYNWVITGRWNIIDAVSRSYDVEGMNIGFLTAGHIGLAVLRRMKPFDVKLHYTDRHRLLAKVEKELELTFHKDAESLVRVHIHIVRATPRAALMRPPSLKPGIKDVHVIEVSD